MSTDKRRAVIDGRLPSWIPEFVKERVAVNVYHMKRLMAQAQEEIPPGARVVDAGAGEGRFRNYFEHTRYIGIDWAASDASWDYGGLDAIGELTALPLASHTCDAAVCTQVLEHVPEPGAVLHELSRVLKVGGRLYLAAPQSWHQHQKPFDFFRYTSFGLRHLLNQSGLEVISLTPMGGYFWSLSMQLQLFNYWTFSKTRKSWQKWLTWPLKALAAALTQIILPLLLFYLDRLDRVKDDTLGYVCVAMKAGNSDGP